MTDNSSKSLVSYCTARIGYRAVTKRDLEGGGILIVLEKGGENLCLSNTWSGSLYSMFFVVLGLHPTSIPI